VTRIFHQSPQKRAFARSNARFVSPARRVRLLASAPTVAVNFFPDLAVLHPSWPNFRHPLTES
jgi:hypothetical protein